MAERRLLIDAMGADAFPSSPAPTSTSVPGAPGPSAIRIAFGVGSSASAQADEKSFKTVYSLEMPVFSLGGLDPDGIHEMDAKAFLALLQKRSLRRRWAARLELEISQDARSSATHPVEVIAPFNDAYDLSLSVLGRSGVGTTVSGGGRRITVVSSLVHLPDQLPELAGRYSMRALDPSGERHSEARNLDLALDRFEFEG